MSEIMQAFEGANPVMIFLVGFALLFSVVLVGSWVFAACYAVYVTARHPKAVWGYYKWFRDNHKRWPLDAFECAIGTVVDAVRKEKTKETP